MVARVWKASKTGTMVAAVTTSSFLIGLFLMWRALKLINMSAPGLSLVAWAALIVLPLLMPVIGLRILKDAGPLAHLPFPENAAAGSLVGLFLFFLIGSALHRFLQDNYVIPRFDEPLAWALAPSLLGFLGAATGGAAGITLRRRSGLALLLLTPAILGVLIWSILGTLHW